MKTTITKISNYIDKAFEETDLYFKIEVEPKISEAKKSIKHPFFNYAILNTDTFEVTYKRKSFTQFFTTFGKRVCKLTIKKIVCDGLIDYKPINKKD